LPLFARTAAPDGPAQGGPTEGPPPQGERAQEATPGRHPALVALAALDPDALSPREAADALYRLKSLMDGAVPDA
jgi:DNA mismatch repair protein MutS